MTGAPRRPLNPPLCTPKQVHLTAVMLTTGQSALIHYLTILISTAIPYWHLKLLQMLKLIGSENECNSTTKASNVFQHKHHVNSDSYLSD